MVSWASTDYETYSEIMDELTSPIIADDLDSETLKNLYESKAVYLENLRTKCFRELNANKNSFFTWDDYSLILRAIDQTKSHVRQLVLIVFEEVLSRKKAG